MTFEKGLDLKIKFKCLLNGFNVVKSQNKNRIHLCIRPDKIVILDIAILFFHILISNDEISSIGQFLIGILDPLPNLIRVQAYLKHESKPLEMLHLDIGSFLVIGLHQHFFVFLGVSGQFQ